jgi:hypothetical protein
MQIMPLVLLVTVGVAGSTALTVNGKQDRIKPELKKMAKYFKEKRDIVVNSQIVESRMLLRFQFGF